ncbi:MAG: hypothetical protein Q7S58_10575 [Candidatus Binatus sp.]|uniref:hypothetical protein n=1 Tax=Candidatus Binatus sp. TaxID=2811406 RepID=UPI002723ABAC|nr:hypothetical protein [Candidatus Binatus sp.]MDO8432838.1 hypothetical protein [Candidatus Binatus sp.]
MKDRHLYFFREADFRRIGKLLADRDAFIVFHNIATSSEPLNIGRLAGLLRREPILIVEILRQLSDVGVVRSGGGFHRATAFGLKVMQFFGDITSEVELQASSAASDPQLMSMIDATASAEATATNNRVVSSFAATVWAASDIQAIERVNSESTANKPSSKDFGNQDPADNAARFHNYL